MDSVILDIEGDYISSFIYSGVLILVDSDFVLHAYSWDDVISVAMSGFEQIEQMSVAQYLKNSSCAKIPRQGKGKRYSVDRMRLNECYSNSVRIGVWPSDINIYKNRIYISSDEGVDIVDFKWINGRVDSFSEKKKIWRETAFALSANNYFRLAIASGDSGLLSYIPMNREVGEGDVSQLLESTCIDCDWQGERLVANTDSGVNLIDFQCIPEKKDFKGTGREYWDAVNTIKKEPPQIRKFEFSGKKRVVNSWIAGEKLFFLTDNMEVGFEVSGHNEESGSSQNKINIRSIGKYGSVIASRTASFGTVVEIDDSLAVLGRENTHIVDDDFATWRIFPRSKNYTNQLHIIKDKHISILAVQSPYSERLDDGYGFSIEPLRKGTWL